MFMELSEGKESSSNYDNSIKKKRKTVKAIRNCLTERGRRKIIKRFLLFRRVGLGN